MKKITLLFALFVGLNTFTSAQNYGEVKFDFDNKYPYALDGEFTNVSNNGKYVVGSSFNNSSCFVYEIDNNTFTKLNSPEYDKLTDNFIIWKASANDVSDAGIIVGCQTFKEGVTAPAYYNIKTKKWKMLPISPDLQTDDGKIILVQGDQNGEGTSITSDGKFIGGYILTKLDDSKDINNPHLVACPCIWENKGTLDAPDYKLQLPLNKDHNNLVNQGDFAFCMSNDGKYLGGKNFINNGSYNPSIWINNGPDQILERKIIVGKVSPDYYNPQDENTLKDGQYFWEGEVKCISSDGTWVVGSHNFKNNGYIGDKEPEPNHVGFKYNTKTKELIDTLNGIGSIATFVFNNGDVIYGKELYDRETQRGVIEPGEKIINIFGSTEDKKIQCGLKAVNIGGRIFTYPYIRIDGYVANEIVKSDLNISTYTNNKTLFIDGEFTSVEIYTILGSHIGTFTNENSAINLSHLNEGIYLTRIINNGKFTTKKIKL